MFIFIFNANFSDLNKIVDGMGEKLARFIQCMMTFVGAYIIGFIYGWQLTLTLLSMLPLMALSGGIMGMVWNIK
jgi:ABC-type multidrug transport system fused ATPase/permease subunit